MDKLDKTLGVTQVDRAATSGNATFAELIKVFKRDIDLPLTCQKGTFNKEQIDRQLNGPIKHGQKVPFRKISFVVIVQPAARASHA